MHVCPKINPTALSKAYSYVNVYKFAALTVLNISDGIAYHDNIKHPVLFWYTLLLILDATYLRIVYKSLAPMDFPDDT